MAASLKVEITPINLSDADEIERAVAAFAQAPNGGLITTTAAATTLHRNLIIALAARHGLPAVYPFRYFAAGGGLISYGPSMTDQYRSAAGYVDRILKGEKPADLPVQAPTKYETVINLKTAKALGLTIPERRAAIMFSRDTASSSTYVPSFEMAARSLKVEAITAPVHDDVEIETTINALGRAPGGGLVVMPDIFMVAHRASIISAAARNNVPAVYSYSVFAREGGLLSYRPDLVDINRRAATYVDRILRGEKPGDLPVQFPTKYETVINLKTAKALGLTIPETLLATADEVIQ
jgi:ABC-type uncharacterized transport system substrate-binding protein